MVFKMMPHFDELAIEFIASFYVIFCGLEIWETMLLEIYTYKAVSSIPWTSFLEEQGWQMKDLFWSLMRNGL